MRRVHGYDALFRQQLRRRYTDLEGRFRGIVEVYQASEYVDPTTARQIAEYLWRARALLEQNKADTFTISETLDIAERYMIWVTPEEYRNTMLLTLEGQIEGLPEPERSRYEAELQRLRDTAKDWEDYRGLISDVGRLHAHRKAEDAINRGLQVRRLKALRTCGLIALGAFLVATPLAVNRAPQTPAPGVADEVLALAPGVSNEVVAVWLTALAVAMVSAAAGYLSGLLQVREERVDLVQYQTSVLKLQLRPIVGAIVSLALFVLLSWDIVPGLQIETRGSLFLVAFLAGFSERYFLRLLELRPDDEARQVAPQVSERGAG
ncbi:MAG: hypothetical protein M3203_01185 [Actinomycetota bacterium]|nr:hypothetical protein [Actinomycetota bacterium]